MDRTSLILLQVLCAVAVLSVGTAAVKCYQCTSDSDPRCADPIDKTMLPIDCNIEHVKRAARALANVLGASASLGVDAFGERYAVNGGQDRILGCQKLDVDVINHLNNKQNVTIRGCVMMERGQAPEEHCRRVSQGMQSSLVTNTFCGACEVHGCNSASGLSLATLAALLPALAVLLGGRP